MKIVHEFKLFTPKETTLKYGKIYTAVIDLPIKNEPRRVVRVYLPPEYDGTKRFPVMYMTDGQNMCDKFTSAYGDWEIDKRMREIVKEGGEPFMLVGIDCPKIPYHRQCEYIFNDANLRTFLDNRKFDPNNKPYYGDKYAKFIVEELKPYIDEHFMTLSDKENTAFGGSSMGGLFAFDIVSQYKDVFGFSLVFSPAICIFTESSYFNDLKKRNVAVNGAKYFIYSGGLDKLEGHILKSSVQLYTKLRAKGFDDAHLRLYIDSTRLHNEKSWTDVFNRGIKMWQEK